MRAQNVNTSTTFANVTLWARFCFLTACSRALFPLISFSANRAPIFFKLSIMNRQGMADKNCLQKSKDVQLVDEVKRAKKQTSILNFFKRRSTDDCQNKTIIDLKRAKLETNENGEFIDVNYMNESCLDVEFQEKSPVKKDWPTPTKIDIESNNVYKTFHKILKVIVEDEHYSHLIQDEDWENIQEFTSLPGKCLPDCWLTRCSFR